MTDSPWILILLIAIPAVGGVLVLRAFARLFSKRGRLLQAVWMGLLALYLLVIVYLTLLARSTSCSFKYIISPFWSYRDALSIFGEGPLISDSRLLKLIILNIMIYIPLGYLLPLALPRLASPGGFKSRPRLQKLLASFPWAAVLAGMAVSMATEFAQLVLRRGLFEFDDIFNNTLGCLIGVFLYWLVLRPKATAAE